MEPSQRPAGNDKPLWERVRRGIAKLERLLTLRRQPPAITPLSAADELEARRQYVASNDAQLRTLFQTGATIIRGQYFDEYPTESAEELSVCQARLEHIINKLKTIRTLRMKFDGATDAARRAQLMEEVRTKARYTVRALVDDLCATGNKQYELGQKLVAYFVEGKALNKTAVMRRFETEALKQIASFSIPGFRPDDLKAILSQQQLPGTFRRVGNTMVFAFQLPDYRLNSAAAFDTLQTYLIDLKEICLDAYIESLSFETLHELLRLKETNYTLIATWWQREQRETAALADTLTHYKQSRVCLYDNAATISRYRFTRRLQQRDVPLDPYSVGLEAVQVLEERLWQGYFDSGRTAKDKPFFQQAASAFVAEIIDHKVVDLVNDLVKQSEVQIGKNGLSGTTQGTDLSGLTEPLRFRKLWRDQPAAFNEWLTNIQTAGESEATIRAFCLYAQVIDPAMDASKRRTAVTAFYARLASGDTQVAPSDDAYYRRVVDGRNKVVMLFNQSFRRAGVRLERTGLALKGKTPYLLDLPEAFREQPHTTDEEQQRYLACCLLETIGVLRKAYPSKAQLRYALMPTLTNRKS